MRGNCGNCSGVAADDDGPSDNDRHPPFSEITPPSITAATAATKPASTSFSDVFANTTICLKRTSTIAYPPQNSMDSPTRPIFWLKPEDAPKLPSTVTGTDELISSLWARPTP